ncbi:MAG: ATP-dependent Clp protease adaptor ClpS [Lachnospiraceae bacterium]|nr:ATP-dependent Clp protease adaptor ClpS [Lachnospiraceae bacterium]
MATKGAIKEWTDTKLKEPKLYQVIMLNDDFTSMEFVVEILIDIFHKDPATAETLMLYVHKNGRAVVGKYPYDIALTKIEQATDRARAQGYPFRLTMEEE